jgi:hypothetical protein
MFHENEVIIKELSSQEEDHSLCLSPVPFVSKSFKTKDYWADDLNNTLWSAINEYHVTEVYSNDDILKVQNKYQSDQWNTIYVPINDNEGNSIINNLSVGFLKNKDIIELPCLNSNEFIMFKCSGTKNSLSYPIVFYPYLLGLNLLHVRNNEWTRRQLWRGHIHQNNRKGNIMQKICINY